MRLTISTTTFIALLTILLVLGNLQEIPSVAQTTQGFSCGYSEGNPGSEYCKDIDNSFASNQQAERAVDMILTPLGLKRNFFLVPCPNIDNAVAAIRDGNRYIFYNNAFMEAIDNKQHTNWASVSILAHEIGHHLNGHTLKRVSPQQSRAYELEADEFSGFALSKLNRSLSDAQAAVRSLRDVTDEANSYYPKNARRLEAIQRGYDKAKSQPHSDSGGTSSSGPESGDTYNFQISGIIDGRSIPSAEFNDTHRILKVLQKFPSFDLTIKEFKNGRLCNTALLISPKLNNRPGETNDAQGEAREMFLAGIQLTRMTKHTYSMDLYLNPGWRCAY